MQAQAEAQRLAAESHAEVQRIKTEADVRALRDLEQSGRLYDEHPALLRLLELEALRDLARSANVQIYVGFDRPVRAGSDAGKS